MKRNEAGVAAVEFALVLPILLLLVLGIIEFSRAYNAQISLSAAAREGVRVMAIKNDSTEAKTATINAAPSLNPALATGDIVFSPATCVAGAAVTITAEYNFEFITGLFGGGMTLTGEGVMQCGG